MEPPELERGSNASGEHSALLLSWKDLSVYSRCVGRGAGSAARNPKALASPNSPLCLQEGRGAAGGRHRPGVNWNPRGDGPLWGGQVSAALV